MDTNAKIISIDLINAKNLEIIQKYSGRKNPLKILLDDGYCTLEEFEELIKTNKFEVALAWYYQFLIDEYHKKKKDPEYVNPVPNVYGEKYLFAKKGHLSGETIFNKRNMDSLEDDFYEKGKESEELVSDLNQITEQMRSLKKDAEKKIEQIEAELKEQLSKASDEKKKKTDSFNALMKEIKEIAPFVPIKLFIGERKENYPKRAEAVTVEALKDKKISDEELEKQVYRIWHLVPETVTIKYVMDLAALILLIPYYVSSDRIIYIYVNDTEKQIIQERVDKKYLEWINFSIIPE